MSQDLFAAFGVSDQPEKGLEPSIYHGSETVKDSENDDDWGDFEGISVEQELETQPGRVRQMNPTQQQSRYHYSLDDLGSKAENLTKPSRAESNSSDLMSVNKSMVMTKPISQNSNVLFDATEVHEVDDKEFEDFSDFIGSENPNRGKIELPELSKPVESNFDLLGLNDALIEPVRQSNIQTNRNGLDILDGFSATQSNKTETLSDQNKVIEEWTDDDWDQAEELSAVPSKKKTLTLAKFKGSIDNEKLERPPSTIPPPVVILSVFSSIFEKFSKDLLIPLTGFSPEDRKEALSKISTVAYLEGYLSVLSVCARIIGGRKLRWKRDKLLSQSMRIGSVSTGRSSGMKVTSIDKSEINKEDREVAETKRLWEQQAGRIKSILTEAKKNSGKDIGQIPELQDTLHVKTLTETEGGVDSIKGCLLCGLKRQERLNKIDLEVYDSFGEWWDEKVIMHRACRNFWCAYESNMRQR